MNSDNITKEELLQELHELKAEYESLKIKYQNFIIEPNQIEEFLNINSERYRTILQTAMDGFWLTDSQLNFLDVNEAYCRMSGYSREELLKMKVSDVEAIETPEVTAARAKRIFELGEDRFKSQHYRKDGTKFDVEVSIQFRNIDKGWFIVFIQDITEQKKAENELIESEIKLSSIINSTTDYIWSVNTEDFGLLTFNAGMQNFFTTNLEVVLKPGMTPDDVFANQEIAEMWNSIYKIVINKGYHSFEHATSTGNKIIYYSLNLLKNGDTIFGISGFGRDITKIKNSEKESKESEERYKMLINAAMFPIVISSFDGKVIFINKAASDFFGVSFNELDQLSSPDFWANSLQRTEFVSQLKENGVVNNIEIDYKTINNGIRCTIMSSTIIDYYENKAILSILNDITEQKKAEKALRLSEEKFAKAFNISPDAITLTDIETSEIIDANAGFERVYGYAVIDVIGKTALELDVWADLSSRSELIKILNRDGIVLDFEAKGRRKSGELIHGLVSGSIITVDKRKMLVLTARDITEHKLAEVKLHKSEEKYRYIVDNAPIGIVQRSLQGSFNFCNLTVAKQFECNSIDEFLLNYDDITKRWNNPEQFIQFNELLLKNGEVLGFENKVKLINGKTKWFALYYKLDSTKSILDGFSLDITERKFAERALSSLATNFAGLSGKAFFEAASKHIATEMGIDYVYVGELTDTKDSVRVIGGFALGEAMGEMLYCLSDTPCSDVIENDTCLYPTGIQQQYPKDYLLQQMGIDSYLGSRIYNKNQEPIGLLVALHTKPLNNPDILGNLFSIFSDRIAAELHRIHANEALHKNEAIQRKMVSNIGDVIVIIDKYGINKYKSSNIEKWFGWKPEEVVDKSTWDNVHPDDILIGQNFISSISSEPNASGSLELRYRKKDDSYCWIEITIVNLLQDPDICGLLGNYHDITERKKAEQVLKLTRFSVEHASEAMYWLTADSRIIDVNEAACKTLGYSRDELLKMKVQNIDINYNYDVWPQHFDALRKSGSLTFITEHRTKNGQIIPVEVVANYVWYGNEECNCAFVRDITERKKAEQAIKESNDYNRQLFSTSKIGLALAKMTGELVDINQAYADIIGYTIEDALQLTYWDITPEKYAEKEQEQLKSLYDKGFYGPYEKEYIHKNGALVPVVLSGNIIERHGDKYIWSSVEDITVRKKAEAEIKLQNILLKTNQELSLDGILIVDENGAILSNNKNFQEIWGIPQEIIDSKSDEEAYNSVLALLPDPQAFLDKIEYLYRVKTDKSFDVIQLKNGRILERYSAPMLSDLGQYFGRIWFFRDITKRKLLEDNLKQSEERLSSFINSASDSFYLLDANLNFIEINRKALEFIGKQKIDIIGKNIADIVPDIKSSGRYEKHMEVIKTGKPFTITDFITHPVFGNKHVVLNSFKVGTGLGVIVYDITLLKKQELEIQKLLKTIENTEVSIVVTNKDGNIEYANPFFTQLTGYSKDEYLGKNPKVLNSGTHTFEFYKEMWNTIKSGNTWDGEFCNRKKNGDLYWEKSIITPIKDEKDEIINFVAVKSDITQEKKHKYLIDISLKIYEKSEHLTIEEILKYSIELGIHLTNSEIGYFHFVNDDQETISLQAWSAKTMDMCNIPTLDKHYLISKAGVWVDCFYKKNSVIHNDYSSLSHKKGLPEGHATLTRDLSVPVVIENQVVAIFGVGNKKVDYNEIDAEFLSIFAENVWNVVRRKNAESNTIKAKEKAEESEKLKTAFLQNMSHEIRTPLNGILGFSNLLQADDLTKEDIKEFTGVIQNSGHRLMETVGNILEISKIETGQLEVQNKSFSLNSLMSTLNILFSKTASIKGVILDYHVALKNPDSFIESDELKLNQILSNLINNALKFTTEGKVEFGYSMKNSEIEFYVKDTGVGIPEESKNRMFVRFAQANLSITRGYEGAGLGLSICKGLVELLDGKIWFESEANVGSTFFFSVPYKPITIIDSISENNTKIPIIKEKIKILMAEDDWTSFQYVKKLLSDTEYTLVHAENGLEVVDLVKSTPDFRMILMDIRMPVMNGIEATKLIKQIRPELPIIAQTAYAFSSERDEILSIGCSDYISKPIQKAELFALIEKYS